MANVILLKKFLIAFIAFGAIPPTAQILQISLGWLPISIIVAMISVTVVPELSCIFSKNVWNWVKAGIEDSDGNLNKGDIGEFLGYYGTFIILRCFVSGYLFAMIGIWDPRVEILYSPLAFAASGGVITYLNSKRKS